MDPDSSSIYPALAAFAILLVLSGLFSATEAAFTGINDSQTKRRAAEGDKRAQQIMGLIRKPTVFISTVRTGSTLCNMLGLAVLSPSLTDLFLRQVYPEMESSVTAYPGLSDPHHHVGGYHHHRPWQYPARPAGGFLPGSGRPDAHPLYEGHVDPAAASGMVHSGPCQPGAAAAGPEPQPGAGYRHRGGDPHDGDRRRGKGRHRAARKGYDQQHL